MITLGQLMQKKRKSAGLTQEQVAEKMGVKRATYAQYESDKRTPKPLTLKKIADALGCSMDVFTAYNEVFEDIASPKSRADTIIDCLTDEGVKNFLEYGDMLVSNDRYRKKVVAIAPVDSRFLTYFGGSPDAPTYPPRDSHDKKTGKK